MENLWKSFLTIEEWKTTGLLSNLNKEQSQELVYLLNESNKVISESSLNSEIEFLFLPIIVRIYRIINIEDLYSNIKPLWINSNERSTELTKLININNLFIEFIKNVNLVKIIEQNLKHLDAEAEFCSVFSFNYINGLIKEYKSKQND